MHSDEQVARRLSAQCISVWKCHIPRSNNAFIVWFYGGRQTPVYVQIVIMKLGEIDTVKETFTAEVFVQARWREPKLDGSQAARETVS